jgi:hypothetical protein
MWAPTYFTPVYWAPRYWPTEGTGVEPYIPVDLPHITLALSPSLAWASLESSWTVSGLVASLTIGIPGLSEAKAEILPVTTASFQRTAATASVQETRSGAAVRPVTVAEVQVVTVADVRRNASSAEVGARVSVEVDQ